MVSFVILRDFERKFKYLFKRKITIIITRYLFYLFLSLIPNVLNVIPRAVVVILIPSRVNLSGPSLYCTCTDIGLIKQTINRTSRCNKVDAVIHIFWSEFNKTRKLWNRKTTLTQSLRGFDVVTKQIDS